MAFPENENGFTAIKPSDSIATGDGVLHGFWRLIAHPTVSGAGALAAAQYLGAGVGLVTSIVAARLLGPSSYGVAALLIAYPTLIWSFASVKSVSVTTRYLASFASSGQTREFASVCKLGYAIEFLTAVATLAVVALGAFWLAPLATEQHEAAGASWLVIAYAASFLLFSLTGTSSAILTSLREFRRLAVLQLLNRVVHFLFVVSFVLAGLDVAGVVLGTAAAQAVVGLLFMGTAAWTMTRRDIDSWWSASLGRVNYLRKELASFFGWNYLTVTFAGLLTQVPLILLGWLRGPEAAAYYRLATSIVTTGSFIEKSLGQVTYPELSARWASGERQSLGSSLRRWTLRAGLPVCLLMLATIPFMPTLIPWIFGDEYQPMVFGVQLMMAGAAVGSVFFTVKPLYYASGQVGRFAKGFGVHAVVVLALSAIFIERLGFSGMAGLAAIGKAGFLLTMALVALSTLEKHRTSPDE